MLDHFRGRCFAWPVAHAARAEGGYLHSERPRKAACPKCKAKFGNNPLYTLETAEVESDSIESDSAEPNADESQAAEPESTDPPSSESATAESTSGNSTSTEEDSVAESTPTPEATE